MFDDFDGFDEWDNEERQLLSFPFVTNWFSKLQTKLKPRVGYKLVILVLLSRSAFLDSSLFTHLLRHKYSIIITLNSESPPVNRSKSEERRDQGIDSGSHRRDSFLENVNVTHMTKIFLNYQRLFRNKLMIYYWMLSKSVEINYSPIVTIIWSNDERLSDRRDSDAIGWHLMRREPPM